MKDSDVKPGVVYLVGAGPGHPGLITRMGYDLLERCDAVAYDALIPLELIASLPQHIERHYVGRRAGKHSMPQLEKNRLLVQLAKRGLNVVRLKGGDTSFFGGTAEEAESLAAAGIQCVVVPGVTAASAVAAVSGLPLTDRRGTSWVLFATGHGSSVESTPVPWKEIAGLRGGTVVIYMGLANLERIVDQLLEGGQTTGTPCMVVQGATTGAQRIIDSTLGTVVSDCREQQLKPPALAVVGQVVPHRIAGSMTSKPLFGKRVLVPCCAQETEEVCAALRKLGAEPLPHPVFVLDTFDDAEGWTRFPQIADSGGWCIFRNDLEVRGFVAALLRNGFDLRALRKLEVVALGHGTEAALLRAGIRADLTLPSSKREISRQELLWGMTSSFRKLVLFSDETEIRSSEWLDVLRLKLFSTKPAVWEPHWIQEIQSDPPDFILFRNPAEVAGFVGLQGYEMSREFSRQSCVIAADELTGAAVRSMDLEFSPAANSIFLDRFEIP